MVPANPLIENHSRADILVLVVESTTRNCDEHESACAVREYQLAQRAQIVDDACVAIGLHKGGYECERDEAQREKRVPT